VNPIIDGGEWLASCLGHFTSGERDIRRSEYNNFTLLILRLKFITTELKGVNKLKE
jgi:hypothetical protein